MWANSLGSKEQFDQGLHWGYLSSTFKDTPLDNQIDLFNFLENLQQVHLMGNTLKGALYNLRTTKALISLPIMQADPGLNCLFTEWMDTVVYVDKQRMSGSDCIGAHPYLDIHCLHMP